MKNSFFSLAVMGLVLLNTGGAGNSAAPSFASTVSAGQASQTLPVPERGFISSEPAETWEQGLLSGNGTIGASVLSRPLEEIIVFSQKHMFVPEGAPLLPPPTATRLFEIRRLIDRGLYDQASQLAVDLSEQKDFRYPDPLMPAFDLRIKMSAEGGITDYLRSTNFQTGETTVHWADGRGVFERRLFVSRADGVAILSITGPGPGKVGCRLELQPREPENKRFKANVNRVASTADQFFLTYRNGFVNAYPGSIQGLEGVARVIARNGKAAADGRALTVTGADEVLVFIDISLLDEFDKSKIDQTKTALGRLPADYASLLKRHEIIHGEIFGRMRLDLGGGADRRLTSEQLIARSTDALPSRALIEKVFDAGRYNIISSTSDLPPTLQGVWAGTYDPPWASDFTHNGNVPSAIASLLMGHMPELMLAYTSYMEWLVPYLEVNAQRIFGARGIVLPSRSTTSGFNNAFAVDFPGQFWTDYMINGDGAIKEWLTPKLEDNYDHRHSSQLYALFDGVPEEIAKSPRLQAAFKRLIGLKLDRHWSNWEKQSGFMSFGLVQLGQASASLGDAALAYRCLVPLINRYWYSSLASTHNAKKLFNMDISGGLPAVLIKMLVASEPGVIRLLPARPAAWPSGTIDGVLCRGQIEIKRLHWDGQTIQVVLKSEKKQDITLDAPAEIGTMTVKRGEAAIQNASDSKSRRLSLPAGREIQIELILK